MENICISILGLLIHVEASYRLQEEKELRCVFVCLFICFREREREGSWMGSLVRRIWEDLGEGESLIKMNSFFYFFLDKTGQKDPS